MGVNYALLEQLEQDADASRTKLEEAIQTLRSARRRFRNRHNDSDPAPAPDVIPDDGDGQKDGSGVP